MGRDNVTRGLRWLRDACAVCLASALFVAVVGPAAAQSTTTIIGSTTLATTPGFAVVGAGQDVPVFQGDASGAYTLSSPVPGTIVSWSFMSAGIANGKSFVLRVLRPADSAGSNWTAVGTSPVVQVTGGGPGLDVLQGPFTAGVSLPIQAGDRIALQPTDGTDTPTEQGVVSQDGIRYFTAPFADASTATIAPGSTPDNGQVVPIQATVQYTLPPVNTVLPAISGTATVAQTLSCSTGTWSNSPTTFAYQWQLDGVAITGETGPDHVIAAGEGGHRLSCVVTATNAGGSVGATSAFVTVAAGGPPTSTVSTVVKHGRLMLDATGSRGNGSRIVGYSIQFSTLPGEGITCGPDSPIAVPVFTKAVAGTATLTVTAANGMTSSSSTSFSAPGVAPLVRKAHGASDAPAHAALVSSHLIAFQCLPAPGSLPGTDSVPTTGGAQISSACEVNAGIVQIEGCGLQPVDDLCTGVPAAERPIVEGHVVRQTGVAKLATGPCGDSLSRQLLAHLAAAPGASTVFNKSFVRLADAFWVSTQPVRVNGLDIFPKPGGAVVLATGGITGTTFKPFSAYLVSSNADAKLGGLPLPVSSKLDLDVSNTSVLRPSTPCPNGATVNDLPLGQFSLQNPFNLPTLLRVVNEQNPGTPLASIPQLPVTGALTVGLGAKGTAYLSLNVALNRVLDDPQDPDGNFTGCTVLTTTNHTGVDVSHFEINAPQIDLGVQIQFKFVYDQPTHRFSGSFAVDVDSLKGQVGGAIDFQNGVFQDAAASYVADVGGGYPIGGGFFIVRIDGKFYLFQRAIPGSQTALLADMRISLGPAVDNNGCGLLDVEGKTRLVFYPGPFSVDSTGALELYCYPVFNRYFHADADGHVEVGMQAGFDAGPISLSANVDGQAFFDLKSVPRVQLDATGSASIDFGDPIGVKSVGFDGSISDRGAGFCASVNAGLHTYQLGVGESFIPPPVNQFIFLKNLSFMWDGCDLSKYRTLAVGGPPVGLAEASRRAVTYTLNAPANSQTTVVALEGQGGAPSVTFRGPGGRTIDTATNALTPTELVLRQPGTGVTLVELAGNKTGKWTITPDPGSPPIALVRSAQVLPSPKISAHVTGSGNRRVLRYVIVPRPGMQVTFLERGKNGSELIGAATRNRGTIAFTPSDASTGVREIVAAITQNGMPSPSLTVARYQASRPTAGRVTNVAFTYTRGGLRVSFRAAPLATTHLVALTLSDGRGLRLLVPRGHTSLFIAQVPTVTKVLRLSVTGVRDGIFGPRTTITPRKQ